MMCIAVSAVCICIFMFFYDSSAYWTKRPFRTVRYWQALPFTLTILLACIVRWAHQTAEMWFPLKPMYDFNLIQQSQKKKEREWAQESFIKYSFSLHLLFFCFYKTPLSSLSFSPSFSSIFSLFIFSLFFLLIWSRREAREMTLPVWVKPDHLLLSKWPEVNFQSNPFLKDVWLYVWLATIQDLNKGNTEWSHVLQLVADHSPLSYHLSLEVPFFPPSFLPHISAAWEHCSFYKIHWIVHAKRQERNGEPWFYSARFQCLWA